MWKGVIEDADSEVRYTEFAGEEPRVGTLKKLDGAPFPYVEKSVVYRREGAMLSLSFPAGASERIYGFGLQLDGLDQTEKKLELKVDHWSRGGGRTHAPVPFYLSSRGYGVFVNTAKPINVYAKTSVRRDAENRPPAIDRNPLRDDKDAPKWQATPEGDAVEMAVIAKGVEVYIFAAPTLLGVVEKYNLLGGGGVLPPLWGLGFTHRVPANFRANEVVEEVAAFREREIPLDLIGLEPGWMTHSYPCTYEWNAARFPDPAGFVKGLLDDGVRVNLWENPYVSPEAGLFAKLEPLSGSHLVWNGLVVDYRMQAAREALMQQHKRDHLDIGISGYKIDEVDGYDHWLWPDHATFPSGTDGLTMRQSYGMLMQKMIYTDLYKPANVRTYGQVRATNGAASALPFVLYSDSYDHSQYITGVASASLSGILWTPEIRKAKDAREWLNRMQTTCFSPLAHSNAWASGKKPWSYPEVTDQVREVIDLRMQLLPYLYTAFANYQQHGTPPFRAMILEPGTRIEAQIEQGKLDDTIDPYAEDKIVQRTDQYMCGPSILVAPFYEKYATQREVSLPDGEWYDFYTGSKIEGSNVTVTAEELGDRIPLFVKGGAVIPMLAEAKQRTADAKGADLELRVYGGKDGSFTLYEDDGETFEYQEGGYRWRTFTLRDGELLEEISGKDLQLFGEVTNVRLMGQ